MFTLDLSALDYGLRRPPIEMRTGYKHGGWEAVTNMVEQSGAEEAHLSEKRRRMRGVSRFLLSFTLAVGIFYFMFLYELPFYIYKPGTAESVKPMVSVKDGYAEEKGTFLLTTVRMSHSNVLNYVAARFDDFAEVRRKRAVLKGRSEAEYTQQQDYVMAASQSSAIQAAYRKAGIPFRVVGQGAMVLRVISGMPAEGVLQSGDIILKIDGRAVKSSRELYEAVKDKQAGESISLTYRRKGIMKTAKIPLAELPPDSATGEKRPAIGIAPADVLAVKADEENRQVSVKAGEIGGPSAGLMFALEIYNQLTAEDISKGYRIAGTGTISPQGNVCSIGGVRHKVIAADRVGADLFFVPQDKYPPDCGLAAPELNASDAAVQAEQIGSSMNIVPVASLEEALDYLAKLPPKP